MNFDDNNIPLEDNSDDASMAKADLYKCGKYAIKLIKMIQDGQELPAWVQAKVTKAADYIASVYHFMEFDIKKSEFGEHIDNSDMYEQHLQSKYQEKLMEAKKMASKKSPMKKDKKVGDCNEDCASCTESCDELGEGIDQLAPKRFDYDEVKSPKYGRGFFSNHNGTFVVGVEKDDEPVKLVAVTNNYKQAHTAWAKVKAKLSTAQMQTVPEVVKPVKSVRSNPIAIAAESMEKKAKKVKKG